MINFLKSLYQSPYNQKNPISAFKRFLIWKGIKLLKINNFKYRFWHNRIIYLNHDSFHSMWLMYNSWVDWEEFNLIMNFVKAGDIAVDVGANMGYYSLWMSKFTGENGHVFAFEPDEINFDKLNTNIRINELSNRITTVRKAVSNDCGIINFTVGLDAQNHITSNQEGQKVSIDSVNLDFYFKENNIQHIAYLKIDVEGFELNVLQGCPEFMAAKRIDIIQLEINNTIRNSGASVNEVLNTLEENLYTLCSYDIIENKLTRITFNPEKENYFAIADLGKANKILSENKLGRL